MAVNKVEYGNRTIIDLTDATATATSILTGYKAYGKDGLAINGAVEFVTYYTGSGDPPSTWKNGDIFLKE